jgi:NADH dehydrogenase
VDQVKSLDVDNVVAPEAKGFADLGIDTTAMAAVLPDYLYRFRESGQYAAITASAKNLKT